MADPVIESDLSALVRMALADLGAGPGILADWLEERGDGRGVLLRRRWKRWRDDRDEAESHFNECIRQGWTAWYEDRPGYQDDVLFRYIRRRFRDAFA